MKLKICGMKDAANIVDVANLLPGYMGFIFYPQSPRYVGADFQMPEIPISIKKVGVFVNEGQETILEIVDKYKLDCVQLHGTESFEYCKVLSETFSKILNENPGCQNVHVQLIKAFGVDENIGFSILERYKGQKSFFLSGGIDLQNAAGIKDSPLKRQKIHAIDVNSKFETATGMKDIHKLQLLKDELSG